MGFYRGPNIVTDGLVLALDAGNTKSYPGSGTTVYDKSGNRYNFELMNGVGYNTLYNGIFTLDGTNDAIQLTSNTALKLTKTIVMWLSTTKTIALTLAGTTVGNSNDTYVGAYYPGQGFYHSRCGSSITSSVDCNIVTNPAPTYLDGKFHMWEFKNLDFGSWTDVWNFGGYGSGYNLGRLVGPVFMYNRNLTSAESLQNYTATKSRFNL